MHMLVDTHTLQKCAYTYRRTATQAQTSFFLLAFFELCETSQKTRATKALMRDQKVYYYSYYTYSIAYSSTNINIYSKAYSSMNIK